MQFYRGKLPAASPLHLLSRQNLAAQEESIPDKYGFNFVPGLDASTHVVRLLTLSHIYLLTALS